MPNYADIARKSRLYPVLVLERVFNRSARRFCFALLVVAIVVALFMHLVALLYLLFALGLVVALLELYFRNYYFSSVITNEYRPRDLFTFTVGRIVVGGGGKDLVRDFFISNTGHLVLKRLGISREESRGFLKSRTTALASLPLAGGSGVITLGDLAAWMYEQDVALADFLLKQDLKREEWLGAVAWVVAEIESAVRAERWWTRDNVLRIQGLAADWSYGGAYVLEKYARDLSQSQEATTRVVAADAASVAGLEGVLTRDAEANALIVGSAGQASMNAVWRLVRRIKGNVSAVGLNGRRVMLLAVARLVAACKDKPIFEHELVKLCTEAARAGNIVLVIDDLPLLLASGSSLGVNVPALLDTFLQSAELPIVALAEVGAFHQTIETNSGLMNRFEVIKAGEVSVLEAAENLSVVIHRLEHEHGIFYTYPAVAELARSAEQYFSGEGVLDQATDLALELASRARGGRSRATITRSDVLALVTEKTSIPLGEITAGEKEALLHLEEALAKRVIGQRRALEAIAGALRRARAGTRDPKRPMGSFLFLGPTGVGKTETAKALATVLFGRPELLLRLDMSEYQSKEALSRLIGSFTTGQPGILATLVRQNPYGVLLLDEFEKTSPEVLNLFLQILDEGFFSDMMGKRVNARNLVFIATSNAGAEWVWKVVESGRDPADTRTELIDLLVSSGIFRPELLNRFDEVIIFHPLGPDELTKVATLLLERLASRLHERGVVLKITPDLVGRVVSLGSNRVFGARPMIRYIQDEVEGVVARRLIAGEVKSGDTVTL